MLKTKIERLRVKHTPSALDTPILPSQIKRITHYVPPPPNSQTLKALYLNTIHQTHPDIAVFCSYNFW